MKREMGRYRRTLYWVQRYIYLGIDGDERELMAMVEVWWPFFSLAFIYMATFSNSSIVIGLSVMNVALGIYNLFNPLRQSFAKQVRACRRLDLLPAEVYSRLAVLADLLDRTWGVCNHDARVAFRRAYDELGAVWENGALVGSDDGSSYLTPGRTHLITAGFAGATGPKAIGPGERPALPSSRRPELN